MQDHPAEPIIINTGFKQNRSLRLPKSLPQIVFVILTLIVIGELIWGFWYITQPLSSGFPTTKKLTATSQTSATVMLSSANSDVKVGEEVVVDIKVSTTKTTDGVDLVLRYNPQVLSLVSSASTSFKPGDQYQEYIGQEKDEQQGIFRVTALGEKSLATGSTFGSLRFKSISKGEAQVQVEFVPNSTTDTNVIDSQASQDVLASVSNLKVIVR